MKSFHRAVFSLALGMFVSAGAWGDLASLVEKCNSCHGDDGVSQWSDVPTIAGVPEFVHSDALFIYRDEARPCVDSEFRQGDTSRPATNMCKVAAELSDDMIDEVAAYYFELPFVPAKQEFNESLAATGKDIHDEHCDRCHSEGGTNPDDEAGILGGQWMEYLQTTLADYASGDREQPKKMQEKMDQLSEADVAALVNYYASQQ